MDKITVTFELDLTTAACVWANRTWNGHADISLNDVAKGLAEEEAARYRQAFSKTSELQRAVDGFKAYHANS